MYELLDAGDFLRLESVDGHRLLRPAPQAIWRMQSEGWREDIAAEFKRLSGGDGKWQVHRADLPSSWQITFPTHKMILRRTDFGHLGIFPEHAPFWQRFHDMVKGRQAKILNLFAYTGGASLALARAGADVVHVDASKTSVAWAKENAALSGIESIRWIVEDVRKFVAREKRRGVTYQGVVLDPPTYGRGTHNEVWKIDEDLIGLMIELRELLARDWAFIMLSSHSPGHTPLALANVLRSCLPEDGKIESAEMVAVAKSGLKLPSGAYSLWERA